MFSLKDHKLVQVFDSEELAKVHIPIKPAPTDSFKVIPTRARYSQGILVQKPGFVLAKYTNNELQGYLEKSS